MDQHLKALAKEMGLDNTPDPDLSGPTPDNGISDVLKRADEAEIREDVFLQAVCLELQTQRERLRHRADMMRRRADEFDYKADELGRLEETIKDQVYGLLHHMKVINDTLDAHAHVEPERMDVKDKR